MVKKGKTENFYGTIPPKINGNDVRHQATILLLRKNAKKIIRKLNHKKCG